VPFRSCLLGIPTVRFRTLRTVVTTIPVQGVTIRRNVSLGSVAMIARIEPVEVVPMVEPVQSLYPLHPILRARMPAEDIPNLRTS
jgi:hypothetical protein